MSTDSDQLERDILVFFEELDRLLRFCEENSMCASIGDTEYCQEELKVAVNTLKYIESHVSVQQYPCPELLQELNTLIECFTDLNQTWGSIRFTPTASIPAPIVEAGQVLKTELPGRPSSYINSEQVTYLFQHGFKLSQISGMYSVHRTTLWRRLRRRDIVLNKFTDINDMELMAVLRSIQQEHPHCGIAMMMGHLRSSGIVVQQKRVRRILRTVDPTSSALRWGFVAARRSYSVPGPNSLWHIDGHHKLIRWGLVTHGGIDGFSRMIVYLQCSNNNSSDTVLKLFLEAEQNFSLPSRVRADKGSENVGVAAYMEQQRGLGRGSFIAGRSVHNVRIERLWRDVFYSVIQTFYSLFYFLESQDMLNIESEMDIFCLHYIFIPRINVALSEFKDAYNNHKMRSEHNWTPYQMWINGMLSRERLNSVVNSEFYADSQLSDTELLTFGIDPSVMSATEQTDEEFHFVPSNIPDLSDDSLNRLSTTVNPLSVSHEFGADLYLKAKEIVTSTL